MKKALVTGSSGDIGEKIVERLIEDNYIVVCQYCKSYKTIEQLKEKFGDKIIPIFGDFSSIIGAKNFCDKLINEHKDISVVINNAGISMQKLFVDTSDEDIIKILQTNLVSLMSVTREIAKNMLWRREGCIINIASIWGEYGGSCEVAYSVSKGGIIAFTKALARELGQSNIRVNCVSPGLIDTKMNESYSAKDKEEFVKNVSLGRMGTADEVAQTVAFLASEKASYISGQIIGVNGGF